MNSLLWDSYEICQIIKPEHKFEEDSLYIFAYYEADYGDAIINTCQFKNGGFAPFGPQFRVSMYEPSDYYYYTRNGGANTLSELNYKTIRWLHEKSDFHISGYEFVASKGVTESYIPKYYSNRVEYYIDGKYVGTYYSDAYQTEVVRLNNEWLYYVTDLLADELPFVKKIKK